MEKWVYKLERAFFQTALTAFHIKNFADQSGEMNGPISNKKKE
ncbi:hypothetical protein B481_1129 [Planococcus halocryophilus Or1]|nr:hypothetical protein B481_1129 [Planococcus halocryophilus Or1]